MKRYRKEYAELGYKGLRRTDLKNAPGTSNFVNQVPGQGLFAESFETRACLAP